MQARDITSWTEYTLPTCTIVAGTAQSAAIDLNGFSLAGLHIPTNFDGTTLTFQIAPTLTGTYQNAQASNQANTVYTLTVAAGQYVPIDNLALVAGWQYIKITTGTTQTTTDTVITLAIRPV